MPERLSHTPAVFLVRSFTAKGIHLHEPVQGLSLNQRFISGLEPQMPVTITIGRQDQYTFFVLRMRNVSEKSCIENQNTYFMFSNIFFRKSCLFDIMWKNIVEPSRPRMATWGMSIACWITQPTNTHSEYAIFIAFPLKQWLYERASKLRYTYIACLVYSMTCVTGIWVSTAPSACYFSAIVVRIFSKRLLKYVYHLHIVTPEHGIVTTTVIRIPPRVYSKFIVYRSCLAKSMTAQICPPLNRNFVFQLSKFHTISLCTPPPASFI